MRRPRTECWRRPRRRPREAFVLALGVLLVCGGVRPARAEALRVAVIHLREDDVLRKLRAEVAAAGLVAVDVKERHDEDRTTASLARAARAPAAVRVRAERELEVVIVGPDGEPLYWDSLGAADEPSEVSAIRAVELLRGRLIELALLPPAEPSKAEEASAPPSRKTATEPDVASEGGSADGTPAVPMGGPVTQPKDTAPDARPPDRARRHGQGREVVLWFGGAYGIEGGNGGLGLASTARLGARVEPGGPWAVSAFGLLPIDAQSTSNVAGTADVHVTVLGVLGHYLFLPREATFGVDLGIGAGGVIAAMTGYAATSQSVGRSETVGAAAALCEPSFTARITHWLRLRAAALVGVAVPRPVVRFDGANGASWGRPFDVLSLGVEVSTPGTRTP